MFLTRTTQLRTGFTTCCALYLQRHSTTRKVTLRCDILDTTYGAIRRHFGKQMNKETKLRILNITAKAALKFGSEVWVLKKREEQRLKQHR
jgi:hypothetical protein